MIWPWNLITIVRDTLNGSISDSVTQRRTQITDSTSQILWNQTLCTTMAWGFYSIHQKEEKKQALDGSEEDTTSAIIRQLPSLMEDTHWVLTFSVPMTMMRCTSLIGSLILIQMSDHWFLKLAPTKHERSVDEQWCVRAWLVIRLTWLSSLTSIHQTRRLVEGRLW